MFSGVFWHEGGEAGTLRETLLPGREPAGETSHFAPTGHYYAGSVPYDQQQHAASEQQPTSNRTYGQTGTA